MEQSIQNINQQANNILLQAADLLKQKGRWTQGSLFKPSLKARQCCMCAHGAILYCGDSQINKIADFDPTRARYSSNSTRANTICATGENDRESYYDQMARAEKLPILQYIMKEAGIVGVAHYKAFKVGLTFDFNDDDDTSKTEVIAKLREAARFAVTE